MAERTKASVLKTDGPGNGSRGFESHSLRLVACVVPGYVPVSRCGYHFYCTLVFVCGGSAEVLGGCRTLVPGRSSEALEPSMACGWGLGFSARGLVGSYCCG